MTDIKTRRSQVKKISIIAWWRLKKILSNLSSRISSVTIFSVVPSHTKIPAIAFQNGQLTKSKEYEANVHTGHFRAGINPWNIKN